MMTARIPEYSTTKAKRCQQCLDMSRKDMMTPVQDVKPGRNETDQLGVDRRDQGVSSQEAGDIFLIRVGACRRTFYQTLFLYFH
mmetsp:Transcript_19201/g.46343  ORF Transcript_19201/g.46343 Transcript_19201/m.46343 type:complete len:84 (-) Transcript_19201:982-1233(-)